MVLDRPVLDWLARGMGGEAGCAKTMEELERQLAAGLRSEGPYLIDPVSVRRLPAVGGPQQVVLEL